jgi:hypothetical protein
MKSEIYFKPCLGCAIHGATRSRHFGRIYQKINFSNLEIVFGLLMIYEIFFCVIYFVKEESSGIVLTTMKLKAKLK